MQTSPVKHEVVTRRVALVTVTYNSESVVDDFLASYVESLRNSADVLHLFVVDNASSDETLARIERNSADAITVIRCADNQGVARGNNVGIQAALRAGYDVVILINNDVTFPSDLPSRLADQVSAECVVVPLIEATEPPGTLWFATGSVSRYRAFAVTHHQMGTPVTHLTSLDRARHMEYAPTCCMAIAAATLQKVGLMDPDFFVYGDDVDFCLRLDREGVRIRLCADVRLLHKASSLTGGVGGLFGSFHDTRAKVILSRKYLSAPRRLFAYAYALAYMVGRLLLKKDSFVVAGRRLSGFRSGLSAPLTNQRTCLVPGCAPATAIGRGAGA